jgi:hypothetical protein
LVVPCLLRKQGDKVEKCELPGALSTVQKNVAKKSRYQPKLLSGGSSFEVQVNEGVKSVILALFLYEEDNGKHYRALLEHPMLAGADVTRAQWVAVNDYIPADVTN